MADNPKERWQELCALAANEQDSERLLALVEEINRLLDERETQLRLIRGGRRQDNFSAIQSYPGL